MSARPGRSLKARASAAAVRIADLATRRARLVVGVWFLAVFILAGQGRNLEKELVIHSPLVNGSSSKLAHEIDLRKFGNDYPMIVLLRGPEDAVERQGRRLARRVAATPPMIVTSPWDAGAVVDGLNPRPGVAALLVRTAGRGGGDSVSGLLPPLQRQVDRTVEGPVRASIAGLPVVVNSLHESLTNSAKAGQLIALPVLLLVLLLVFRSVLAAFVPLMIGGSVVVATRGILSLLLHFVELDLFVIGISAMMGLALGVDYSLLVVSRFREERKHAGLPEAMVTTVTATGRAVLPAGGALLLAMFVAQLVLQGVLIRSVAIGVGIATVLSVFSALCIVPALLVLFGRHLDRWALPPRRSGSIAPLRWSRRAIGRPGVVLALVFALVLLSAVAFNLHSGIATAGLLPTDDPARIQQEEVEGALGPGWVSPTEVVVDGRGTPVTSESRLKAIVDFQRRVEADPGVASTVGLAPIERGARQLAGFGAGLAKQERGLDRLESGLTRVGKGAARSTSGLARAAAGSGALNAGVGAASGGAGALAGGLEATSEGSGRLSEGLGHVDEGSGQLAQGTAKASSGAGRLASGIARAAEKTGEIQGNARLFKNAMRSGQDRLGALHTPLHDTEAQLAAALAALRRMTGGKGDAEYAAALAAVEEASRRLTGKDPDSGEPTDPTYDGVGEGVEAAEGQFEVGEYLAGQMDKNGRQASRGFEKLADASGRLDRGLRRLAAGSQRVSNGVAALDRGGETLSPALRRLSQGARKLSGGLELLDRGSGRLADGMSEGARKSRALPRALRRIGGALEDGRKGSGGQSQLALLRQRSPGLFHSGYFVLAALDGSPSAQRSRISSLVSIDRGGADARVLVIPKNDPTSNAARETTERIEGDAEGLARRTGAEVLVGGVGPVAMDANDEFRGQSGPMRLAMALISLLVLIPLLRSLTVPLLATLINLLTVSASFGVLALLFNTSLLGGPGYVDVTVIPGAIMVIFGLAIDYEVFVFARIREEYLRTGSTREAVMLGLDRTAHVVTGAAVIMITVFLSFSVSGLMSLRNFGVAQAIAVFIDAFIVRLIIVPAVMLWLGDRCWWIPRWLSRRRAPSGRSPAPRG